MKKEKLVKKKVKKGIKKFLEGVWYGMGKAPEVGKNTLVPLMNIYIANT